MYDFFPFFMDPEFEKQNKTKQEQQRILLEQLGKLKYELYIT